jgi:phosphohistidine phosphatase
LLIIRHADAADREAFALKGKPDSQRPLTREGVRKMREVARGLKRIAAPVDLLVSSPLIRARQTADIVAKAFGKVRRARCVELAPDAPPESTAAWLRARREGTIAIVGHEPHLSLLIAHYCAVEAPFTSLKKGGACMIEIRGRVASLEWLMQPGQLREL